MTMKLEHNQIDALYKLFNKGISRSNTMLKYLSQESPVCLKMSALESLSPQELMKKLDNRIGTNQISSMQLVINGEITGIAMLIFPSDTATTIVNTLADEERQKLDQDAVKTQTLNELGNIFFNGLMGSISTILARGITYMVPRYQEGTFQQLLAADDSDEYSTVLFGKAEFESEGEQGGLQKLLNLKRIFFHKSDVGRDILFFFKVNTLEKLLIDNK